MDNKDHNQLTFVCLSHFDEELELKAFESVLLNKFDLPPEYLKRNPLAEPAVYTNPMIEISWKSWCYRAKTAIALYNGSDTTNT